MSDHKLKVRVGPHEFEAEGSSESVERQFQMWRDMIEAAPPQQPPSVASPPPQQPPPQGLAPIAATGAFGIGPLTLTATGSVAGAPEWLAKLYRRDGPVISLTVLPNGSNREADAALLILYGQKLIVGEDQITGVRLIQGLDRSGINVPRADRVLGAYMNQYVIRSGSHRAVRYRMTNPGMTKASELAKELVAMVP